MTEIRRFHTTMSLGEKRHVTPDGFLVCQDVPMARIGDMLYGPEETPVHSADGVSGVTISREPDEVFREDTILSMIGKPVTNDHPNTLVGPAIWKDHTVGTVMSARRGVGTMSDMLIGDIMICEPQAIQDVLDGKIEVSCGYDAEYEPTGPGRGRQKNIVYNHLALVDKGRCGPRCAIGDYQPPELRTEEREMAKTYIKDKKSFYARIRTLMNSGVAVKDADIQEALEKEGGTEDEVAVDPGVAGMGDVHIHMSGGPGGGTNSRPAGDDVPDQTGGEETTQLDPAIEARFQGIETAVQTIAAAVQKLAGAGEEEEQNAEELANEAPNNVDAATVAKAKDSAFFRDGFQETLAMAEIIVPGIRVPSFDAMAKPGKTYDTLCRFRRTVLDLAWNDAKSRPYLQDLLGSGRTLATGCKTCDKVRDVFRGLWLARRHDNNGGATITNDAVRQHLSGSVRATSPIQSPADLNKFIAERRAKNARPADTRH